MTIVTHVIRTSVLSAPMHAGERKLSHHEDDGVLHLDPSPATLCAPNMQFDLQQPWHEPEGTVFKPGILFLTA